MHKILKQHESCNGSLTLFKNRTGKNECRTWQFEVSYLLTQ